MDVPGNQENYRFSDNLTLALLWLAVNNRRRKVDDVGTTLQWLYGLVSAAIGAAASGVTAGIVAPESFNFSGPGLAKLGALCGVNALVAVAMYLKSSPLPAIQTTTQTTTLTKTTVVDPAPPKPPAPEQP